MQNGYAPNGKRRKIKVSARTKTEAKAKLQQLLRDREDGQLLGAQTVRDAVESWLAHGLTGRQESTVVNRTILARTHVIPALGARKLAQLSAEEVDQWLAAKAKTLSTDTLHRLPVDLAPVHTPCAGARLGEAQCCPAV